MSDKPATLDDALEAIVELADKVGKLNRKLKKMKFRCARRHSGAHCIGFRLGDDASVEQDEDEEVELDTTEVAKKG